MIGKPYMALHLKKYPIMLCKEALLGLGLIRLATFVTIAGHLLAFQVIPYTPKFIEASQPQSSMP